MLEQIQTVALKGEHAGCGISLKENTSGNWRLEVRQEQPYCFLVGTVPDRQSAEKLSEVVANYFTDCKVQYGRKEGGE